MGGWLLEIKDADEGTMGGRLRAAAHYLVAWGSYEKLFMRDMDTIWFGEAQLRYMRWLFGCVNGERWGSIQGKPPIRNWLPKRETNSWLALSLGFARIGETSGRHEAWWAYPSDSKQTGIKKLKRKPKHPGPVCYNYIKTYSVRNVVFFFSPDQAQTALSSSQYNPLAQLQESVPFPDLIYRK